MIPRESLPCFSGLGRCSIPFRTYSSQQSRLIRKTLGSEDASGSIRNLFIRVVAPWQGRSCEFEAECVGGSRTRPEFQEPNIPVEMQSTVLRCLVVCRMYVPVPSSARVCESC